MKNDLLIDMSRIMDEETFHEGNGWGYVEVIPMALTILSLFPPCIATPFICIIIPASEKQISYQLISEADSQNAQACL